jgi:hypothetical protein
MPRATIPGRRARLAPLVLPLVVVVAGALLVGSCGSSTHATKGLGPNPTSSDPGPNTSTFNPGPNPTTGGPVTLEGTLQLTPRCMTLQLPAGPLDLHFVQAYTKQGSTLYDDTGHVIAHDGDHIAVAGHPTAQKDACGTRFNVDTLVTVLPKS